MNKEVYQEGWLIKSPPTKRIWRARWRRRWFTLKQGEIPGQFCLEYYTDRNCRKLKGVIDLDQCEQVDSGLLLEHRKQKFQYMFDIKTPRRTYYLAADTETDMRDWVNCICQVCNLHDFTKQPGERQYYNLCENGAPISALSPQPTTSIEHDISNDTTTTTLNSSSILIQAERNRQSTSVPDVIKRTEEMSINNTYQNNDCSYVNTEYSNRETMICDTKFQEHVQQLRRVEKERTKNDSTNISTKFGTMERSHSFKMKSTINNDTSSTPITSNHSRTQSLNEQTTTPKSPISATMKAPSVTPTTPSSTGVIKKIPENLVLSDTFVESNVEPSPALSTCSGPYIPISECFSGSPKYLNEDNPTTPLNNLDPKFYDTPRSHNNVGLNLTNDQSYSPKIYNCPQQIRPRSGRSSPTDSESVFTDDEEWSHASPRRESIDRNTRPSDSSVENEAIVFTYTQRFSKIPEDKNSKNNDASIDESEDIKKQSKRKNQLILETTNEDEKNREFPQLSDTDNSSPAIGPKDASSVVDESYDIPRSHHLPYYNINHLNNNSISPTLITNKDVIATSTPNLIAENDSTHSVHSKTLPRSHFYTNAAPTKVEGNFFRYDFIEQADAPAVNRSLKPKLSLEEKAPMELPSKTATSAVRGAIEKSPRPPSVDRKLKPAVLKSQDSPSNTNSLRRRMPPLSFSASSESDFSINHKELETRTLPRNSSSSTSSMSIGNTNTIGNTNLSKGSCSTTKSNSQLQYFDLDVANPPKQVNRTIYANNTPTIGHTSALNTSIDSVVRAPTKSNVIYNSVDFLKTEAFKRIREDAEKNRMKD